MYYINTSAGEAMARKGHAYFPDDFQRLRPGENFTAWRVGQDWEIETLLTGTPLLARLKAIETQDDRERERALQYVLAFADENCFDAELACNQLRSLWTAHCLRYGLNVDTRTYDHDLTNVWAQVSATEDDTACWSDFNSFDTFMSADLV